MEIPAYHGISRAVDLTEFAGEAVNGFHVSGPYLIGFNGSGASRPSIQWDTGFV